MKRFVIDYSTFYFHTGNITGIPRTVKSVTAAVEEVSDIALELVIFDEYDNSFKHYSKYSNKILDNYTPSLDDIFISLGAPWMHANYNDVISNIKDKIKSFYFVLYDLIPYLFPHFYEDPEFGEYYFRFIYKITSHANRVLCISNNTRSDLIRLVDNEGLLSKIKVFNLGCDFIEKKENIKKLNPVLEVPKEYILCVGTLEFRKNQNFLLKVYRNVLQECKDIPSLILAGKVGFGNNQIEHQIAYDPVLKGKVKLLNCLRDDEIDLLYKNALFTVYPSLYEGWGLPVCESLMHGKNVVCSNTSSMVEIAPNLCHLADPVNMHEWSQIILLLSTDSNYRLLNEQKIIHEYKPIRWHDTAQFLLEV